MPTSAFLMQLIAMIYAAGVQLAPSHMKRDYNKWADELTHPDFTGFRPDRQLPVREAFSHFRFLWAVLDDQMRAPTFSDNSKVLRSQVVAADFLVYSGVPPPTTLFFLHYCAS